MFALVFGCIPVVEVVGLPGARIQRAIEGFFLVHPELEVTSRLLGVAGECDLWYSRRNLLQDGLIRDVAHLKVLLDYNALFVADTTFAFGHKRVACLV